MTETTSQSPLSPAATQHLVVDLFGVATNHFQSNEHVLEAARRALNVTPSASHEIQCSGKHDRFSVVIILPTAHIAIHTCPEQRYIGCDMFVSRHFDVAHACQKLVETFHPTLIRKTILQRGIVE
ncbi:MAG: S-adenosylmethionine decarboxylase [Blastocatellia bacterium]|nr:S-adenosylmethionine decarboxylase [Blastocatellia bacterium]